MSGSRLRTILGSPLWILQLATGAKSFKDNPLIGSKRLNKHGLHESRMAIAHRMAGWRRRRMAAMLPVEHRSFFDANGYVRIDDFLPAAQFAALRDDLLSAEAPAREMLQGDTITRRIAIDEALLMRFPALRALLAQPLWRGLTRYVASFDSEPVYYIQTILTHSADATPDPQTNLHADTFHPTMKAWFFLTDVAEEDGPFCYVPGSHRATPERLAWERARSLIAPEGVDHLSARGSMRATAADIADLGLPDPVHMAVPANTLVVADTCGFHARVRATRPAVRVEIWAYSRRNPFLPWTGLDPLTLPGLATRRIPLMWKARDLLARWIGQPWRKSGRKRPAAR